MRRFYGLNAWQYYEKYPFVFYFSWCYLFDSQDDYYVYYENMRNENEKSFLVECQIRVFLYDID